MMNRLPTITLPQGAKDILPDESKKIGAVESTILSVLDKYGYSRVCTPLLEYLDVLSLGLDSEICDRLVKFIDPSTGRVVGLRPDITPQIARIATTRMRDYPRPLRLCYNENVIRYEEAGGSKAIEICQVGAELLSEEPSAESDAEMVVMACESLRKLGLTDFKVDIADIGFVKATFEKLGATAEELTKIKDAIAIKDIAGLNSTLSSLDEGVDADSRALLAGLTTLYGEEEILEDAKKLATSNEAALARLENLEQVLAIVADKGFKDFVTIDLGEVRGFDYYTGIIIEGFASGIGKPLLSGGRYDDLLERYGMPGAGAGLAFNVEHIISALAKG